MPGRQTVKDTEGQAGVAPATFGRIVRTVLFAFFGVRKREAHEQQTVRLSPVQIIVAGLVGGAVFVVSLVLLAKFVVSRAMS